MTEEEFKEEVENIKTIYDKIDPRTMCINPDIANPTNSIITIDLPHICEGEFVVGYKPRAVRNFLVVKFRQYLCTNSHL